MVQEFHVLRCFSCKTFQVQQVKKSKKWSCRMCGEKQSLIKVSVYRIQFVVEFVYFFDSVIVSLQEYGRGTGADCRRHVQKLNALRGELHEVENETFWTQWEQQEECDVQVSPGDETQKFSYSNTHYTDSKSHDVAAEERRRKRKKSFTSRDTYRRYSVEELQDKDTAHEGAARQPQPRHHDATFDSSPKVLRHSTGFPVAGIRRRTDALSASPAASLGSKCMIPSTASQVTDEPQHSVPLHSFSAPSSSHQQHDETKPEAKNSKWARFLPSVCVADEDEEDGAEQDQYLDEDQTALVRSPVMPVATVLPNNTGSTDSGQSDGVGKVDVFEKLSQCVYKQPISPSIIASPAGSRKPVCVQPLPKPALSFSTLFQTDEDFDDAY
ncbi:MRN complex-interacting protein [Bagarius yarrelli]|uniref:MRN complex-interacting protein n=1 Tax=Bagarius yarrelli TaxID=175774 RepID=A0A556V3Q7_BAGYA|nr:MRN complex-interacting protein [Bagarius yarrelli]